MEEVLKQILDVVIDIKEEQKIMAQKMGTMEEKVDTMEQKVDTMEQKVDTMQEKLDKLTAEQLIMNEQIKAIKTDMNILNFKVSTLMKEQEDTKFAVVATVQKVRRSR